ncbi:MAG: Fic family protein [SAR324 cluster bacterium]|nr:Fic family protein [SAR324 cluster bacterium]
MPDFTLPPLPPDVDLESPAVLKHAVKASRALAELKGISKTIPNQSILIDTLPLLEAKDSSEIENIITTHDEIYKQELFRQTIESAAAKEVSNYGQALREGYFSVKEKGLLTNNQLLEIHALIEENRAGFRKLPGTELKNQTSGETVYTPPQDHQAIVQLMTNLERVINEPEAWPVDPLIKMTVIHYQFESIHPFYDGNGRVGRILNILYLVKEGLLDMPVLYLSRYVIKNKGGYYRGLQRVRTHQEWEEWVLYLLKGVEETALFTSQLVSGIQSLMHQTKTRIRSELGSLYSQDLLNNLFRHPYTKIDYLAEELGKSRQTASKYLDQLVQHGFLLKVTKGKHNYYINEPLFELFARAE